MRTGSVRDRELLAGGPALFRLVRFWSRRWAVSAATEGTGDAGHIGHVLLLEAVDAASADGGTAAIADVATELGLDRSNASRMLAEAVAAGLVDKAVSPGDARRTQLKMTPAGHSMLDAARSWQQDQFARLVADWPADEAHQFARYLVRLASQPLKHPTEETIDDHRP